MKFKRLCIDAIDNLANIYKEKEAQEERYSSVRFFILHGRTNYKLTRKTSIEEQEYLTGIQQF